jgi:hypothetical protein
MVEAAKDIGPRVRAADPLFSGYFSKFASRGDTALELAAKVESGDSDLVPDLDDARKKLLDSFYPVSQVCFDQLTGK